MMKNESSPEVIATSSSKGSRRQSNLETGYLKHVFAVFDRLGYTVGDSKSDWDVLWSHEYPFEALAKQISALKPHQKVNHFPASGYITNKVSLVTSPNQYIPRAFKIPEEKKKFLSYAKNNPEKLWVQKRNSHRGIKIKRVKDLDLQDESSFIQEYVDRPFLIDGRKFDIGVYAILTSIDPLRVYMLENDALFRFCSHDYHPFNPKDVKKYVVGDDYTPVWHMPSLKVLYNHVESNFKVTFDTYLKSVGKDPHKMWNDIRTAINSVYLSKEPYLIGAARKYKSTRNFFEMVRFDFVLDEELNVYLMEVNMSPNLSSGHFEGNTLLYEQVVFNLLSLVGVSRPVTNDFSNSPDKEADMRVSDKDITVFPEWCIQKRCLRDCKAPRCQMCHQCYTMEMKKTLKYAVLEHINKGQCTRVFPPPMSQEQALDWTPEDASEIFQQMSRKNQLMSMWYIGKCRQNRAWC
ncbi:hypothetical protein FSP39_015196 [Pinctada imbricata]|uniref:Uncharacterized protein n=1 Tax=Pinctada imbricata TaxID=66713 RepID=A0AA88XVS7_PINIB|nr:hypothetical protein FSP39_015196 [Pinctada imbricata]